MFNDAKISMLCYKRQNEGGRVKTAPCYPDMKQNGKTIWNRRGTITVTLTLALTGLVVNFIAGSPELDNVACQKLHIPKIQISLFFFFHLLIGQVLTPCFPERKIFSGKNWSQRIVSHGNYYPQPQAQQQTRHHKRRKKDWDTLVALI